MIEPYVSGGEAVESSIAAIAASIRASETLWLVGTVGLMIVVILDWLHRWLTRAVPKYQSRQNWLWGCHPRNPYSE